MTWNANTCFLSLVIHERISFDLPCYSIQSQGLTYPIARQLGQIKLSVDSRASGFWQYFLLSLWSVLIRQMRKNGFIEPWELNWINRLEVFQFGWHPFIYVAFRVLSPPRPAPVWVPRPQVSSRVSPCGNLCRLESRLSTVWCPSAVASVSSSSETDRLGKLGWERGRVFNEEYWWLSERLVTPVH